MAWLLLAELPSSKGVKLDKCWLMELKKLQRSMKKFQTCMNRTWAFKAMSMWLCCTDALRFQAISWGVGHFEFWIYYSRLRDYSKSSLIMLATLWLILYVAGALLSWECQDNFHSRPQLWFLTNFGRHFKDQFPSMSKAWSHLLNSETSEKIWSFTLTFPFPFSIVLSCLYDFIIFFPICIN